MMELREIEEQILGCKRCSRLCNVNPFPMPHIVYCDPKDVEVFVIGRNPGLENEFYTVPKEKFMTYYREKWWECRVGKYLRERLGDDIVKSKFFFTNICKCSSPNNSPLLQSEKENCLPYLLQQLEAVQPKVIVTISGDAKQMLAPHVTNSRFKGLIPVFNLYHPSYLSRGHDPAASRKQDKILKTIGERLRTNQTTTK
jgi:uracil-DNA glycosylase